MLARLRRKDMERERRKAIRNAYRRVREAKKKKGSAEVLFYIIFRPLYLSFSMVL